jgi:hypothetical protein
MKILSPVLALRFPESPEARKNICGVVGELSDNGPKITR